jgi:tetratricopeptide (TPR) repeat protein
VQIFVKGMSVAFAVTLLAGCAARGPRAAAPPPAATAADAADLSTAGSLSEYIRKIRHLSANAKPVTSKDAAETLEARDPALAAELLVVRSAPTAERHRAIAERYRERGILDLAYQHFNDAIALNPRDAAAYEGLARVWRDWGLPELAVGDAHRATFYAPQSASARNTFGTIMQALGQYSDASAAYELASWLDPGAAYAVNNLCYLAFVTGRINDAIDRCNAALRLDPSLAAARNNLALAFAASGRMDIARTQFLDAGDQATGLYNTGITYLASCDERSALAAFDAASKARPTFAISRARAELIRARLARAAAAERASDSSGQ